MKYDVISPPRSAMDVFELLPEGTHAEVIENQLYMPPTPTFIHQEISADLHGEIRAFVKQNDLGKIVATVNVHLDEDNVFEPDLVFLSNENLHLVAGNGRVYGAPDLVIEILSASNKQYDRVTKKEIYARAGVKEYWIVDPITKETWGFFLVEHKFKELLSSTGKIKSKLLKKTFYF